jgi:hypothetical protein
MSPPAAWTPYEPPLPDRGEVLDCCIPYTNFNNAIIKPHPAIIWRRFASNDLRLLAVVGGTAAYDDNGNPKTLHEDEIILDETQRRGTRLTKPTKFGFNANYVRFFSYTDRWFPHDLNNKNVPCRYGFISLTKGPFWEAVVAKGLNQVADQIIADIVKDMQNQANAASQKRA